MFKSQNCNNSFFNYSFAIAPRSILILKLYCSFHLKTYIRTYFLGNSSILYLCFFTFVVLVFHFSFSLMHQDIEFLVCENLFDNKPDSDHDYAES